MANFFRNFPLTEYKFGNEETTALFQNISAYINIIDELKNHSVDGKYSDIVINDGHD